jgi:SAM-dependent methyltransferase
VTAASHLAHRLRSTALGRRVEAQLYRGSAVECPCCGGMFRRFAPYGVSPRRPRARCPGCGAMERHRHLWLFLSERTDLLTRPQRLLHFAPEAVFRRQLEALPGLCYVTADLAAGRARVRADIMRVPFADASFDAILCNHVLEHVPDDKLAMGELLRILRPGGWAVVQVPQRSRMPETLEDSSVSDPRERERLFGQRDHLRQYGADYAGRLAAAGFEVEAERFGDGLPAGRQERYGLKSELIHLCRKPA